MNYHIDAGRLAHLNQIAKQNPDGFKTSGADTSANESIQTQRIGGRNYLVVDDDSVAMVNRNPQSFLGSLEYRNPKWEAVLSEPLYIDAKSGEVKKMAKTPNEDSNEITIHGGSGYKIDLSDSSKAKPAPLALVDATADDLVHANQVSTELIIGSNNHVGPVEHPIKTGGIDPLPSWLNPGNIEVDDTLPKIRIKPEGTNSDQPPAIPVDPAYE